MFNHTLYLRFIFPITLIILIINSSKVWASVANHDFHYSQYQPPVTNNGGSLFYRFNYNKLINN
ncbi:hypothetical protein L8106_26702 [Lyngbya sp. PCC 8106]|nr:hypothetical protein L8106_26702 [Lyngbya sp. PCC 8106]